MKRDCPHCRKSMGGRFMQTTKLTHLDKSRNCPLCAGDITMRMYPEEMAARVIAVVAFMVAAYWAKEHRAGYLAILVSLAAFLVLVYVALSLLLRNKQRFAAAKGYGEVKR